MLPFACSLAGRDEVVTILVGYLGFWAHLKIVMGGLIGPLLRSRVLFDANKSDCVWFVVGASVMNHFCGSDTGGVQIINKGSIYPSIKCAADLWPEPGVSVHATI
eukprot:scaffold36452_cov40-Prasinocladus_malaysianus.AAC.1